MTEKSVTVQKDKALNAEILAAYQFVDSLLAKKDWISPLLYVLREAFLEGIAYEKKSKNSDNINEEENLHL